MVKTLSPGDKVIINGEKYILMDTQNTLWLMRAFKVYNKPTRGINNGTQETS